MPDLFFYDAGCAPCKGVRGLLVLGRRLLRRLLLPIFQRQREILEQQQELLERLDRGLKDLAERHAELVDLSARRHEALVEMLAEQDHRQTEARRKAISQHRAELAPCASDYVAIVQRMALFEASLADLSDRIGSARAA